MTTDVETTRTLRAGFIGAGFMGRVHSAAARAAGARTVRVSASTPRSAGEAAHRLGIEAAAADAEQLIADDDIDIVHVCSPNGSHAPHAAAAIAAGRHVICEKPLALDAGTAESLVTAAAAAGVVATVPFVYRYHPMVREARARVAAGDLGVLLSVDAAYLQDWMLDASDDNWRADAADGGPSRAFADIGSHLCDLVEFVCAERIVRVSAVTRTVFAQRGDRAVGNEDLVAAVAELESGALATMLVSQMAPGRKNALTVELHGTGASMRFDQERPEELWVGARSGSQLLLRDPDTAAADAARIQSLPAGHPMGYQDAFNAFVADTYAAVAGARPDGLPTFADGLRAVRLTEAILQSARTRQWVEVAT